MTFHVFLFGCCFLFIFRWVYAWKPLPTIHFCISGLCSCDLWSRDACYSLIWGVNKNSWDCAEKNQGNASNLHLAAIPVEVFSLYSETVPQQVLLQLLQWCLGVPLCWHVKRLMRWALNLLNCDKLCIIFTWISFWRRKRSHMAPNGQAEGHHCGCGQTPCYNERTGQFEHPRHFTTIQFVCTKCRPSHNSGLYTTTLSWRPKHGGQMYGASTHVQLKTK